ncbi:MAG TPA: double zinc ribbon domain-containing protein [Pyrinomonadaceae bacterium]|nr:double zinc ribbon domain-containing protein [Pyrinomonadaceae bacterium]
MPTTCEYCRGALGEGATKCANCGAAVGERGERDFRFCPHCERRLLALGSPACSYCGRALPEDFVKAREQMWQRVKDLSAGRADEGEKEAIRDETDEAMRRALKALLGFKDKP